MFKCGIKPIFDGTERDELRKDSETSSSRSTYTHDQKPLEFFNKAICEVTVEND